MTLIQVVPMENNFINNTKNNRYCMDYFRQNYESFMGIDSKDVSYQAYSLDDQIERYSKNIAFWYIQLDKVKKTYGKNKIIKIKFIKEQILRFINSTQNIFPENVPHLIHQKALNMVAIYS